MSQFITLSVFLIIMILGFQLIKKNPKLGFGTTVITFLIMIAYIINYYVYGKNL
ncbi:MAG: hypothetical protein ACRCXZ_06350 [Patescibacteria group bacterium]